MKTNHATNVIPIDARTRSLSLSDGAVATSDGHALELRDREGRLLVRYLDGSAEIAAPDGDLVLAAPAGRVRVRSALDVEIEAARDVVQRAGRDVQLAAGSGDPQLCITPRRTSIDGEQLRIEAREADIAIDAIRTVARTVATKAETVALTAERYELVATRLWEKSRDVFREVADLCEARVGRMKTVVASTFALSTRRTVLASKEDTSVDGRKILLG